MDFPTKTVAGEKEFCEEQWLKILFLISDAQSWLNETEKGLIYQLPLDGKKKLLRRTFYLTAPAIAHILERHYHKIPRYPTTGKFTISVCDIMACIRDSFGQESVPVNGSLYIQRVKDFQHTIGFDHSGHATSIITVISDHGGRIITAFPGRLKS